MRKKKILFFFNHKAEHEILKILTGELPTERLYGLIELRKLGWHIDLCDERITKFSRSCKYFFQWINVKTLRKASKYDFWLVKDDFSIVLTLAAYTMKKKLIYIDSLFSIAKNPIRKFIQKINVKLAYKIIAYSNYQVEFWGSMFNVNKEKFIVAPYTIDTSFYIKGMKDVSTPSSNDKQPYILATGRDVGRDFHVLVNAAQKANVGVKLVTLPYLVPETNGNINVEVYENISYPKLFNLYYNAAMIVVPLKSGIVYPSGIRAVLEGMMVGKPVICTATPILKEYIPESLDSVIFVNPADEKQLVEAIQKILKEPQMQMNTDLKAQRIVESTFCMDKFVSLLDKILLSEIKN